MSKEHSKYIWECHDISIALFIPWTWASTFKLSSQGHFPTVLFFLENVLFWIHFRLTKSWKNSTESSCEHFPQVPLTIIFHNNNTSSKPENWQWYNTTNWSVDLTQICLGFRSPKFTIFFLNSSSVSWSFKPLYMLFHLPWALLPVSTTQLPHILN